MTRRFPSFISPRQEQEMASLEQNDSPSKKELEELKQLIQELKKELAEFKSEMQKVRKEVESDKKNREDEIKGKDFTENMDSTRANNPSDNSLTGMLSTRSLEEERQYLKMDLEYRRRQMERLQEEEMEQERRNEVMFSRPRQTTSWNGDGPRYNHFNPYIMDLNGPYTEHAASGDWWNTDQYYIGYCTGHAAYGDWYDTDEYYIGYSEPYSPFYGPNIF